MNLNSYLQFRKSNCVHCYKCIRHCPVKAISFQTGQANILPDECVLCGSCYAVCPQNAKTVRNDIPHAKMLIRSGGKVIVSLAPSYIANYCGADIVTMKDALMRLGFSDVEETAVAATIVKTMYDKLVRQEQQDVIISSCCHSVNMLVQKHYPKAVPYLAGVLSPMLAHGQKLKAENPGASVVFIGPCVSKKEEAELYPGYIDCVLTFEELTSWFADEGIAIPRDNVSQPGGKERLFPAAGGILQTMDTDSKTYSYLAVDGLEECMNALKDILDGKLHHCFIEMSACRGSCVAGPAMDKRLRFSLEGELLVRKNAGSEHFAVAIPPSESLRKNIEPLGLPAHEISTEAIEAVLRQTGKTLPEHELNCGSCGYDTCRKKAEAVLLGKAEVTMCLPYLMSRTQAFSDNIIAHTPYGILLLDMDLAIKNMNRAALDLFGFPDEESAKGLPIAAIIDPKPYQDALGGTAGSYEAPFYLKNRDRHITQTIIYDRENSMVIGIIRDVTDIEQARRSREQISARTVEVTDRVIEKQMRTVQEIASLLGETTAETLAALTKLKETIKNE